MTTKSTFAESQDGNVLIIAFGDSLKQIDESNVTEIGAQLNQATENLPNPVVVLDMTLTEFFGSSFIEVLFRVWKNLSKKPGAQLAICGLQPYCREVLKVTRLDKMWQVFPNSADAVRALKSPA